MCIYSMVHREITTPGWPNYVPWTPTYPTPDQARDLREIFRRLDAIDKKLGLKDCDLDAAGKRAFEQKLEERAAADVAGVSGTVYGGALGGAMVDSLDR